MPSWSSQRIGASFLPTSSPRISCSLSYDLVPFFFRQNTFPQLFNRLLEHPSIAFQISCPHSPKKQKEKKTVFVRRCCGLSPDRLLWSNCELAKQTDRKDSSDGAPIVAWNSSKDARPTTRCKKKVGPPPCSLMRALLPTENCWKWLCMYFHNPFRPFALLSAHREGGALLFFC